MPGEHHQRLGAAAHRPQVLDVAEGQALGLEAERRQAPDHDFLAAFVARRLRRALDQLLCQFKRFIHEFL